MPEHWAAGDTGRVWPGRSRKPSDDLVDFLQAAAAGELQEDFREVIVRAVAHRADVGYRAARDDLALQDDADPVAHLLRDLQRVRAHQDADAALRHPAEDVLDQARSARIEADHRLVHDHRLRAMEEGGAHHEALLHAVGEALDELVLPAPELEELQHLGHARADAVPIESEQAAVEAKEFSGRELLVDVRTIGNETE